MNSSKRKFAFGRWVPCIALAALFSLACETETADIDDDAQMNSTVAVASTGTPVCKFIGTRSEGWYWSNTDELIDWDFCKGIELACSNVGTRKEAFVRVDTGDFIARGSCAKNLRVVAHGKNCGGSIGYSCEYSHTCYGMPGDGVIGGTGKCRDTKLGFCLNHADCARTMPSLAPPGYFACENKKCVRKVATAALGEVCGGFANMKCSEGLDCVDENGQPAPTGTCQFPRVAEGAICGGFVNVQCVAGLECLNAAGEPAPTGTCQRGAGAMCGGRAGFSCAEGFFCAYEEGTCIMPDHSGTCTEKIVGFGCAPPNPAIDNRVCDCNANTQIDRCHARAANVSIAHTGPCDHS